MATSGAAALAALTPAPAPPLWLVDCDAGIDDAQALFVLAHANRIGAIRLLAVTCVAGNCGLDAVVGNVCAALDAAGVPADVAVYVGADRPLVQPPTRAPAWHGDDGLGGTGYGGAASRARVVEGEHAALAIGRLARVVAATAAAGGAGLNILTLGPLTNVALALRLFPGLTDCVGKLVVMGGAYRAIGNATHVGEFNIVADPEGAAVVLTGAFPSITLSSWELTLRCGLPPDVVDAWLSGATPGSAWLRDVTAHLRAAHATHDPAGLARSGFCIPDPLAAILAAYPALATETSHPVALHVELGGTLTRGMTVVDWDGRASWKRSDGGEARPANVCVVKAMDVGEVARVLRESVGL